VVPKSEHLSLLEYFSLILEECGFFRVYHSHLWNGGLLFRHTQDDKIVIRMVTECPKTVKVFISRDFLESESKEQTFIFWTHNLLCGEELLRSIRGLYL
jgi:hypothetical protein